MTALLAATLRLWAPLALAAAGGVLSERVGVANLALEGMLVAGAYVAIAAGGGAVGCVAAVGAGAAVGLTLATLTRVARLPAVLAGIGLNLALLGITAYGVNLRGDIPLETERRIAAEVAVPLTLAIGAALWWTLSKTPLGLRLRGCGESAETVAAAGISVGPLRFGALTVGGGIAGLGGAVLALVGTGEFTDGMTAGRGYIALAAVILGRWSPLGAMAATLLFAAADAAQLDVRNRGVALPTDLLGLLPYVLALAALAASPRRSGAPAALSEPGA